MKIKATKTSLKILDFDLETIAAGFADPEFVPNKITCAAFSWIGEDEVNVEVCGAQGIYGKPRLRAKMLMPLLRAINEADVLTGHNIIRFDLPILQSEILRLGLIPLKPIFVQDTMKIIKTRGFKKGQDNLGALLKSDQQKFGLIWQQWEDAYDEKGWETIKERAVKDVIQHKQIREMMIANKWLRPPTLWKP